ncbi:DUF6599 family protein [Candidatus Poribacteria bacterium]
MLNFCIPKNIPAKALVISLLAIAIYSGCSSEEKAVEVPQREEIDLLSLVSVQMPGWEEEEATLISKQKDMLKHMDKDAELYLAYGVRRLAIKKYKDGRDLPMLVEVYEFDSSANAYGIYSFDTAGEKLDIGQDSAYGHGLLRFWKDKFLVRVLAEEEYALLEKEVLSFGRQIDSRILTTGSRPRLLSLIPEERLIPDSLHFFHKNICLNNICYMPESTMLGLSAQTNALTVQYNLGGKQPPLLLLIEYPDETAAKIAFTEFGASYFQGESMDPEQRINVVRMGGEDLNALSLHQNFVIMVLDARTAEICNKLVAATLAKIQLSGK